MSEDEAQMVKHKGDGHEMQNILESLKMEIQEGVICF